MRHFLSKLYLYAYMYGLQWAGVRAVCPARVRLGKVLNDAGFHIGEIIFKMHPISSQFTM